MKTIQSTPKRVPHSDKSVYDTLTNLDRISNLKEFLPKEKPVDISIEDGKILLKVPGVGNITMGLTESIVRRLVRFSTIESPVPFSMSVMIEPAEGVDSCVIQAAATMPMNPIMWAVIEPRMRHVIEEIATAIASIPYPDAEA